LRDALEDRAREGRPHSSGQRPLGLPKALSPHSFRHSWVSHLTEDGVDRRFIQEAVGHRCDTLTAIYTNPRKLHQVRKKLQGTRSTWCRSGISGQRVTAA
jgi:site-specific recombinase XerC